MPAIDGGERPTAAGADYRSTVEWLAASIDAMRIHLLTILLVVTGCAASAPPIKPDEMPTFDSAYVCRVLTGIYPTLPANIDIARDCVAIDPGAFRELLLAGIPVGDLGWTWKHGHVAIGRSAAHGDRFFLVRGFRGGTPCFVRPGVPGSYMIPAHLAERWWNLVYDPVAAAGSSFHG